MLDFPDPDLPMRRTFFFLGFLTSFRTSEPASGGGGSPNEAMTRAGGEWQRVECGMCGVGGAKKSKMVVTERLWVVHARYLLAVREPL
jgi:hypothetical protein